MGVIVSCGEAATTTLCTLWTFGILFHNPSIKPAAARQLSVKFYSVGEFFQKQ